MYFFLFLEIHQLYTYYPQITSPWNGKGGGVKKFYKFLSPYSTNVTYQILSIFGPVFIEKIMLTDERRRMPTHSNRLHK